MATITVSADNLPKDSGSRYWWAPFDPATSAFKLPHAAAVSGDYGGLAISHMPNVITDTIASGAGTASGIDIGGYNYVSVAVPQMTPCLMDLQASVTGGTWFNVRQADGAATAASLSALSGTAYIAVLGAVNVYQPLRYIRLSAQSAQTAARTLSFIVKT